MLCFVEFNEDGSIRKIYGPFETAEAAYEWGTLHVKGLGHTRYEWHAMRVVGVVGAK